jgi:hypothetical protein
LLIREGLLGKTGRLYRRAPEPAKGAA